MTTTPNKDRLLTQINACENPRLILSLLALLLAEKPVKEAPQ